MRFMRLRGRELITIDTDSHSTNSKAYRVPSTSHDLDRLSLADTQVTGFERKGSSFG